MTAIAVGILTGLSWALNLFLLIKEANKPLTRSEKIAKVTSQTLLVVMVILLINFQRLVTP
jgi:hypothetical protein